MKNVQINPATSPTICLLPFMHTYITADGSLVSCCEAQETKLSDQPESFVEAWNSDAYQALRRDLIAGRRPEACIKCWRNEDAGFLSARQETVSDADKGFYGNLSQLECQEDGLMNSLPTFIEIKTSNVCNLKCRMCHPESSHRLSEDREIYDKYRAGIQWPKAPLRSTKTVRSLIANMTTLAPNLHMIRYSGGEPLLDMDQYKLTHALAESCGDQVELRYATNLTHLKHENEDVLELWRRFRKVHVKVSVDGIDDVYEYIRVGSKFQTVIENFKRLLDARIPHLQVSIGCTVSALNVYQLPEVQEFFLQFLPDHAIRFFLLHDPKFLSIRNIPEEFRGRTLSKLGQNPKFVPFAKYLTESRPNDADRLWNRMTAFTSEMDRKLEFKQNFQQLMSQYLS